METIKLTAPIKKPEDIEKFLPSVKCRNFYVYHHKFMPSHNGCFEYVNEFINIAHKNNCKIFLCYTVTRPARRCRSSFLAIRNHIKATPYKAHMKISPYLIQLLN